MASGASASHAWVDMARGRPRVTIAVESPLSGCVAQDTGDSECCDLVCAGGEADAKANCQPWGNLTQRVASLFAFAAEDEGDSEDDLSVVEEVAQQARLQYLSPAPFGDKLCPCQGEVLIVLGHYGWLSSSHRIDHPAASRNGGRIYFHVRDVVDHVSLVEGDRVDFFLYVDEQGLGAEELSLQGWDTGQTCSPVGMNPGATEFVPKATSIPLVSSAVDRATPLDTFVFNYAYWSDDSDTDSTVESEIDQCGYCTDDSDSDSSVVECRNDRGADLQRKLLKKKPRAHSAGSSSTASPSDSEIHALDGPPPGLLHPSYRPPPGLTLWTLQPEPRV